jgi:hypothetical protein
MLEGSRFVAQQFYKSAAGGSRERPKTRHHLVVLRVRPLQCRKRYLDEANPLQPRVAMATPGSSTFSDV